MNYLDYEVLQHRKSLSKEEQESCFRVLERLSELSMIAQKEGLLAMEVYANELKGDEITECYYRDAITHVVDGCDPGDVELFLSNEIVFVGADSFQGYLCYLIMQGILSIQAGDGKALLSEKLRHCFPPSAREKVQEHVDNAIRKYL